MRFTDRLSHAWNAFVAKDTPGMKQYEQNNRPIMTSSTRLDRTPLRIGTERSIIASIYNRIAIDVAAIEIRHSRVDQNGRFLDVIKSDLNECLEISANKDQTSRAFFMDVVLSMFDEGTVAIVPIDTTMDITKTMSYDIQSMRTGRVVQWMPDHVRVDVYNDRVGNREEITLPKDRVCIIENPLYEVMNKPNSTLQRLRHKLALLDSTDDKQNSDKLNMIIQLPYTIKTKSKMEQAEERRKQVEMQLTDGKYGIAYIDGTEKVIQLGHPIENRLMEQIASLTDQLYAQLGLTPNVFNGTASDQEMLNYNNRTIEPIVSAIVDEMRRKFLTKTARTQGQSISFFRDPFSLVTINNFADVVDKLSRNEVINSNEVRAVLGFKPVDSQRAEALLNKNINPVDMEQSPGPSEGFEDSYDSSYQNEGSIVDADISSMSPEELQSYLTELEAYGAEIDELSRQVDEA